MSFGQVVIPFFWMDMDAVSITVSLIDRLLPGVQQRAPRGATDLSGGSAPIGTAPTPGWGPTAPAHR
jgi:hypothetical protein